MTPRSRRVPTPPWSTAGRGRWALGVVAAFLLVMFVAGRTVDLTRHLETVRVWTGTLGVLAPGAYVAIYVLATLLGVPGLPFTLLAPALFGALPAFLVMVVASALSAALAFLIARYVARGPLARRLETSDGFARLAGLLQRHDWAVIPFVRIVPVAPFAVVNYGFGLTAIGFWRYVLWSELAMIPMNAVLVLGAGVVYRAIMRGATSAPLLVVVGLAGLLLATLAVIGRRAVVRE